MSVKSIRGRYPPKSILFFIGLSLTLNGCLTIKPRPPAPDNVPVGSTEPTRDDNLALGNPSRASVSDPNNYLLVKSAYTLLYSRQRGIANWPGRRCGFVAPEFGLEGRQSPDQ